MRKKGGENRGKTGGKRKKEDFKIFSFPSLRCRSLSSFLLFFNDFYKMRQKN